MKDAELFSRDPEQWDKESLEETKRRIAATVAKFRKARESRKSDETDE